VPDDQPQSLAAVAPAGDAQTLYQQGYTALLQKNYAGAEGAFGELVKAFPNDPLAGNAQYWIGETYFVRGQYKPAADAFLKGYRKYKSGEKAPDTLLKLGMALGELGQKDAACSTFNELKTKFPGAPEHIIDDARAERKQLGC
jgi:tol-pal system protein YbgF